MISIVVGRMLLQSTMHQTQLLLNPDITDAANLRNRYVYEINQKLL